MNDTTAQMLTRITEVVAVRKEEDVNARLKEGWRLLSVEQVPMRDGGDTWVETKYVLGFPNQEALSVSLD
ncbi:hypothetical protein PQU63_18760 [Xanthomonas protegens]|uniref:Uncharacterized protein n=1 Tax=Xanthomonas protegens TaxID=3380705 RepID=A0ABU9LH47_9XANT